MIYFVLLYFNLKYSNAFRNVLYVNKLYVYISFVVKQKKHKNTMSTTTQL